MKASNLLYSGAAAFIVLVACDKINPERNINNQFQEQSAIESVIAHLTGQKVDSFEGKTFDPTIGAALDSSNPSERSVKVKSAQQGEAEFRALAGIGSPLIKESPDGLVLDLSGKKFGKLTFHKADGGSNSGYVDVDIKCIPKLTRISYKTEDQWGDNSGGWGDLVGYKTGDVFKDNKGRFYIVVQEHSFYGSGWMLCMEPGMGKDYKFFDPYKAGEEFVWLPNRTYFSQFGCKDMEGILDPDVIGSYLELCASPEFSAQKKKIIAATGRNVFPEVALWNTSSKSQTSDYEGFATERSGYAHYIGDGAKTVGVKIIYAAESVPSMFSIGPKIGVKYIYLPADASSPYSGQESYFIYTTGDTDSFNNGYYENGTVVVYTATPVPFNEYGVPPFEKVEIEDSEMAELKAMILNEDGSIAFDATKESGLYEIGVKTLEDATKLVEMYANSSIHGDHFVRTLPGNNGTITVDRVDDATFYIVLFSLNGIEEFTLLVMDARRMGMYGGHSGTYHQCNVCGFSWRSTSSVCPLTAKHAGR